MSDSLLSLSERLVKKWQAEVVGLRASAKRYAAAGDYAAARDAVVASNTTQTLAADLAREIRAVYGECQ